MAAWVTTLFQTHGGPDCELPGPRNPPNIDMSLSDYQLFFQHCCKDFVLQGDLWEDVPMLYSFKSVYLHPFKNEVKKRNVWCVGFALLVVETGSEAGLPDAVRYLLNSERVRNNLPGNWQDLLRVTIPLGHLVFGRCGSGN